MNKKGFTLLEVMVSVGVLAILAGIVIVAINPTRQISTSRNAQRTSAIVNIQGAINHYTLDNAGSYPAGIDATLRMIGTSTTGCAITCNPATGTPESTATSCLNLAPLLTPTYTAQIPADPTTGSQAKTYYAVKKINMDNLMVRACSAELGRSIEVTQ